MTSARRSLLTDYSKFKADIGSAAAKTRPSQPCHNHRSSGPEMSTMDVAPSVKCGPAVISPCNGPVNGNRTSLEKLEEEMQRIMVQVALEQQSGHDYTVTTMCTDDYYEDDDGSSSETTMESLEDPVLEDSLLKSHHSNKEGQNECATSTKEKMEMSDPSLSAHDLFDMDSDDDDDSEAEGEMNDNSLTRPIRTHGHQSMPMLGLQDFSPVLAPPCPTPRRLSNQYQTTTSTGMNQSAPAVASSVRRRMGGNNNSNASLTDYMETYDEEHRREKSYLRGTGCATEDLRQELSQIVLPTRRRQKTLPKRSKTWDEKLKNAVATQDHCGSQLSASRHGSTSAVPRATLRKSRSVDAQTARGMLMATIPIPRPRNNNRNESWNHQQKQSSSKSSNGGSLNSLNSLSSSTHSRARNDNILLQIANRGGAPQQPKPKPSPAATTTWTRNGRSTIRKSKSIGGEASTMPVMAAPPVRRFRRHRKTSDNNDNNNPLQHLHNSTGQLLYDYHSDVLGMNNSNTSKGSGRMMPPKSKSLGSDTTPDTSTGAVLSSKKGSKKTKKYVATNNGSNNSSSCFNSSFNNSFVTGSRITKGAPSWL